MANAATDRRGFLTLLADLVIALLALVVAIPALGYFFAPLRRKAEAETDRISFSDAGPLSDFPVGQWRLVTLEMVQEDGWKKSRARHAVWIRRLGEGAQGITVLTSICPHLGCPINWHPDQSQFVCPCHGGVFSADGQRQSGPPPRNMDPLELEVREGRLRIRWQDFKIGVAERIPVSV